MHKSKSKEKKKRTDPKSTISRRRGHSGFGTHSNQNKGCGRKKTQKRDAQANMSAVIEKKDMERRA